MGLFTNDYPYTDFHELNLDFVLNTMTQLQSNMDNFIQYNEIKFHDPIEWDITEQYTKNTVVTNAGVAYLSKQAIPAGVDITNEDYWLPIGIFNVSIDTFRSNITVYNEAANNRSSRDYSIGDIIWWHDYLYYVTEEIITGDALSTTNLSLTTVVDEIDREINDRKSADNALNIKIDNDITSAIATEVSDRNTAISNAITTEVSNRNTAISNAIATEVSDRNTAISNIKIGDLANVNANLPTNGQVLKYDINSSTWVNANEGGGSGEISSEVIAATYNSETLYNVGDYCYYLGGVYRKIGSAETGVSPTTTESWTQVTVTSEIETLYKTKVLAVAYNGSTTFTTGVRTSITSVTLPKGYYIFTGFMYTDDFTTSRVFLLTSEQTSVAPIAGINPNAKMAAISAFFNIATDKTVTIQIYSEATLTTTLHLTSYFIRVPSYY